LESQTTKNDVKTVIETIHVELAHMRRKH